MNEDTIEKPLRYYEDTIENSMDLGLFYGFIPGDFD
jgi:hypothetical protein